MLSIYGISPHKILLSHVVVVRVMYQETPWAAMLIAAGRCCGGVLRQTPSIRMMYLCCVESCTRERYRPLGVPNRSRIRDWYLYFYFERTVISVEPEAPRKNERRHGLAIGHASPSPKPCKCFEFIAGAYASALNALTAAILLIQLVPFHA